MALLNILIGLFFLAVFFRIDINVMKTKEMVEKLISENESATDGKKEK